MDISAAQSCDSSRVEAILRQRDEEIQEAERKAQNALRQLYEESALLPLRAEWRTLPDRCPSEYSEMRSRKRKNVENGTLICTNTAIHETKM